jgi:hypothetical protein
MVDTDLRGLFVEWGAFDHDRLRPETGTVDSDRSREEMSERAGAMDLDRLRWTVRLEAGVVELVGLGEP